MLPFKIYDVNISDYENNLLKQTIKNHKKRWNVSMPRRWSDYAKVSSNMRFLTKEQYGSNSPLMTFETLMYNYAYDCIDNFVEENYPEKVGIPYHTEYCWYMYYEQEGGILPHNHVHTNGMDNSSTILCSGSYYVEIPEDGIRYFNIYDKSPKEDGKIIESIRPKIKQLFLFDSFLFHSVVQKETKNNGITIAFNAHLIT